MVVVVVGVVVVILILFQLEGDQSIMGCVGYGVSLGVGWNF